MDDFLSAKNPERAVTWWMASIDKLTAYLEDLAKQKSKQHGTLQQYRHSMIDAKLLLATACMVVRRRGGYEFENEHQVGTGTRVWQELFGHEQYEEGYTEADVEEANNIIAFILARRERSDYFKNLATVFLAGNAPTRAVRFVSSAIYTYKSAQRAVAPTGKNEHVGKVGERLRDLTLTVDYVHQMTSEWQENYIHMLILVDADGRKFKWVKTTVGSVPAKGDKVKLTGTVKEHAVYKGTNQTVLTRCVIVKL